MRLTVTTASDENCQIHECAHADAVLSEEFRQRNYSHLLHRTERRFCTGTCYSDNVLIDDFEFALQSQRNAVLIANYELTPNMSDHKNHLMEKMGHEIS